MTESSTIVWAGAEKLREFLRPIDAVKEHARNTFREDVRHLEASLVRFGQVRSITVGNDGETLVQGHHLRRAAMNLGWTHMAVTPAEFRDDEEEYGYLMADNVLAWQDSRREDAAVWEAMQLFDTGLVDQDRYDDVMAAAGAGTYDPPEAWGGGYAEDPEAAERRAAALESSQAMKEVVLMLDQEQYEAFGKAIRVLMPWYKTTGVVQTVLTAVERSAVQVESQQGPRND